MRDNLFDDALALARQARDGVDDPELVTDVLAAMDADELRRLVVRLAALVDLAAKSDGWDHFAKLADSLAEAGGWS